MKKITAILICAILLFNWVGYRFMISYFQDKAGMQLQTRLDADNYDESQLISVKIPASHLSFYTNSGQFERTNGQVEIKGVQYKYVKKRFYNDSLEFICIPDHTTTKLLAARDEFFKCVNDLQTGQGKNSDPRQATSKNFESDYYTISDIFKLNAPGFVISKRSSGYFTLLPHIFLFTAEQPPETLT